MMLEEFLQPKDYQTLINFASEFLFALFKPQISSICSAPFKNLDIENLNFQTSISKPLKI